jgi:hypothetical protein
MRRAYIYILELTNAALTPVRATTRFGRVDPVFQGASYWDRIATMLDRARGSGLYHAVWAVGAKQNPYRFEEHKGGTVGWDQFSADLRSGFVGGQPTIAPHP